MFSPKPITGHLPLVIDTNIGQNCSVYDKISISVWKVIALVELGSLCTFWEQIQFHPSSSFSPQEFSSFRCLTFYNDQWIARLTSFQLWCSNVAFLSTSWFTPSPHYLLLEVRRSFGCVGKEKELHQIVNIWPFSAEHSFSCQLETCCCEQG